MMKSPRLDHSDDEEVAMTVKDDKQNDVPFLFSSRFLIAILLCFALFCSVTMRTDLGIAMVCMVNSTAYLVEREETNIDKISNDQPCQRKNLSSKLLEEGYTGTILWSPVMQSRLFSAVHYGGLVSVLPAGIMSDKFDPKLILSIAVGLMTVVTLLSPLLANFNYFAMFVARVILGLGDGMIMPTQSAITVRWFPAMERSTAAAICSSGNQLATSIIYWLGAALCASSFLGGWPAMFYLLGLCGCLWLAFWTVFATSVPGKNRFIKDNEKAYLQATLGSVSKHSRGSIPWRAIATSMPVIADLIIIGTASFIIMVLQAFLPTYFKDVLFMDLRTNGLYTTIPFLSQFVSKYVLGITSDQLKKRGLIRATLACKIFQFTGCVIQSSTVLVLAFLVDCRRPTLAFVMLIIQGVGAACCTPGVLTSLLCIAPKYSGTLNSLAMLFGQIACGLAPNVVALIRKKGTPDEWTLVFIVTAIINMSGAIFFCIFASAEEQPWARDDIVSSRSDKVQQSTA